MTSTDSKRGSKTVTTKKEDSESDGRAAEDLTVIAHRGFAGENPENTVAAMEAATEPIPDDDAADGPVRPADIVEIDVVPTADGDVVVFHDHGLSNRDGESDRLTDVEGIVWETDTPTVTDAEVLGSGETVPRLNEVCEAVPSDVSINVELKNPGRMDLRFAENLSEADLTDRVDVWRPFVEQVVNVLDRFDNEILCSSFCEAAIAVTREISSYPVAPIVWESIDNGVSIAEKHDAEAIHAPKKLISETPFHDPALTAGVNLVELAHADGRQVNVWNVETWYEAQQLASVGVDGITADYSGLTR